VTADVMLGEKDAVKTQLLFALNMLQHLAAVVGVWTLNFRDGHPRYRGFTDFMLILIR
jgi:hypothetical protein